VMAGTNLEIGSKHDPLDQRGQAAASCSPGAQS
jgi:hypothetical protein